VGAPRDLGRKSIVLVVSTWVGSSIGFVSTLLIARRLGPDALGALGFGVGLAGVLSAVVLPGFAQAHTKRVAEGWDLGRCLGTMGAAHLALQAVMVALFVAAWRWWPGLVPEGVDGLVLWSLLASQVLSSLSGVVTGAFVGRERAVSYALVLLAGRLARFVGVVAVLIWLPDVRWVATAYALDGAVSLLLGLHLVYRRDGTPLRGPDRETFSAYWRYATPLLITSPIGILQDSLDRVLVARWAGLTAAGYYHVARALWELLGTLNAYPFQLLFARLSRLFVSRDAAAEAEARRVVTSTVDKLLFLAVPLACLLWALRWPIVTLLYGPAFAPATGPLMVFVVTALAQTALNPYHFVIYALEQHARMVPITLIRLPVYLAVMVVGVALWGATGAAAVRLLLVLFPAWVFIRWTRELAGIGFERRTWVYAAGFALFVTLNETGRVGVEAAGLAAPLALAVGALFGAAAYGLWLWSAHPLFRDNLRYARDLVHPGRFAAFLRTDRIA
jgi:O-antigen/teichoic acid export membrane protein